MRIPMGMWVIVLRSMLDEMEGDFQEGPFYCSMLFDGSTASTYSEKEVVSIKYLKDGVPGIRLLG